MMKPEDIPYWHDIWNYHDQVDNLIFKEEM